MFGTETETETSTTMVRRPSVVVVLEDFEGFSTETTSDLIISCSHYVDTLPIVLVLGVASSSTALVSVLYHLFWYGLFLVVLVILGVVCLVYVVSIYFRDIVVSNNMWEFLVCL